MKKNQWIDTGTTMVAVLLYMESVYIACSLECGSGICIRRGLLPYRYYNNLGHSDLCHFRYPYWTGKERLCCLLQLLSLFLPSSASYCWLDSVWEMVCQNESSLKVTLQGIFLVCTEYTTACSSTKRKFIWSHYSAFPLVLS